MLGGDSSPHNDKQSNHGNQFSLSTGYFINLHDPLPCATGIDPTKKTFFIPCIYFIHTNTFTHLFGHIYSSFDHFYHEGFPIKFWGGISAGPVVFFGVVPGLTHNGADSDE